MRRTSPAVCERNGMSQADRETSNPKDERFSAIGLTRRLLRTARTGALATLDPETGGPFASLVTLATDPQGAPVLLLSDLAVHTRNFKADPRVSLLVEESGAGDPLAAARVSLTGRIARISEAALQTAERRFVARHKDAAFYSGFKDFSFYCIEIDTAHLVAGFGRIVDIAAADVLIECSDCAELLGAEADAVAHMNADHADAIQLYATRLAGAPPGDWRIAGLDPEGMDLCSKDAACRVLFPERVCAPGPLRAVLKQMAERARSGTPHGV